MSSTWNATKQGSREARGQRFAAIRKALELKQDEFADRLNAAATELGIAAKYRGGDISTREGGRKELDIEDYTLASHIDPEKRSWFWLAYGRELPNTMKIPRGGSRRAAEG